jgi:hypothetical protein
MTLFDRITLLTTGLVALYLIWRFIADYRRSPDKPSYDIYYSISFTVLLVAGLLLIVFGYQALESPLVVIVAVLIPAGLSLGLVTEFFPQYEKAYLTFAVLGLIAIAITRFTGPATLATILLIIVHAVSGLLIFGVPIFASSRDKSPGGFVWVTVGGALIGLGGIALAFLKTGGQLLFFSAEFVFIILAPLLLLMTLAFAWGFVKNIMAA